MSVYNKLDDHELISLLKKGDQIAYTEIYKRYHAQLYINAYNKLGNREESRDMVHDLFVSLWHKKESLELQTTLMAYLHSAIRYRVFDLIARQQVKAKYIDSIREFANEGVFITDHLIREKQLAELIAKEIAALPAKMREVFELSRVNNFSHKQIAERLNLSEKTVKKQVNNSLKILRSKLGDSLFSLLF
ncbi:RNA polymerase sigma-70 factor [Mucilaginibacter puniceus]